MQPRRDEACIEHTYTHTLLIRNNVLIVLGERSRRAQHQESWKSALKGPTLEGLGDLMLVTGLQSVEPVTATEREING